MDRVSESLPRRGGRRRRRNRSTKSLRTSIRNTKRIVEFNQLPRIPVPSTNPPRASKDITRSRNHQKRRRPLPPPGQLLTASLPLFYPPPHLSPRRASSARISREDKSSKRSEKLSLSLSPRHLFTIAVLNAEMTRAP